MAQRIATKTTFEPERVIEPFYSGGSVASNENGSILATALGENVVLINILTGQRLATIEGDGEAATSISLTPSASHLILCSRSLSMRIYALDLTQYQDTITPKLLRTLKPHTSPVVVSAVDETGTLLATGGADGVVKIWDIRGGYTTHTFHGHDCVISALCFFKLRTPTDHKNVNGVNGSTKRKRKGSESVESGEIASNLRLASGGEDGNIRIWDLQKRKSVTILSSHVSLVRTLDFSEVNQVLLSGSRDKTMIFWSSATWTIRNTIPVLESIECGGFLEEHNAAFTGGESGHLRIWDYNTGKELTQETTERRAESEAVVQAIYSPGLPYILSVHLDQSFIFHSIPEATNLNDVNRFKELRVHKRISGNHDEIIDMACIGGNKDWLAIATNLDEIRILDLRPELEDDKGNNTAANQQSFFGADVGTLKGHEDIIICLDVDWSGHWLATGAKDNTARLWRIDSANNQFTCFATFTGHAESLGAVSIPKTPPPSGSVMFQTPLDHPPPFLMTGSQDKTIKRWEITNSTSKDPKKGIRATYTRKAHDKDINALDINHNSTLFASASQDRTVKIWSLEDGETVGILRGHRRGVWSAKFAPTNTPSINSDDGQAGSSSRGLILTGSGDKTLKIWSLSDFSCLRTFEGHTNSVLKVAWLNQAPNSSNDPPKRNTTTQIASAGGDGLVKVWDAHSGELECTLDNHTDRVWAVSQHVHSSTLISGGGDGVITFWKDTTQETQSTLVAISTARVEQDQELQNHIHTGNYREAITLALQLNHPKRLLSLFTSVTKTFPPEENSFIGLKAVDDVLANLSDTQLFALLCRLRDWNVNARTAPVAQKVLNCLLRSHSADRFTNLKSTNFDNANTDDSSQPADEITNASTKKKRGKTQNVKDVLDALTVYTQRHYHRMEDLIDESYLVEYTLREMDELGIVATV